MSVKVIWPSKCHIRAALPECFKKLFLKTRTIDCAEVFMDTSSSLDFQACLWCDNKSLQWGSFLGFPSLCCEEPRHSCCQRFRIPWSIGAFWPSHGRQAKRSGIKAMLFKYTSKCRKMQPNLKKVSTATPLFTNIEWYCLGYQWFSKFKETSCWLIFLCLECINYTENSVFNTILAYIEKLLKISVILYIFIFHQNMVNLTFFQAWFHVDHNYY